MKIRTSPAKYKDLTTENLALQEEIHNLKNDSESIRREARRLGIIGGNEQSPVSTYK